jgi:5-methylcytosine-specific restriction endonuclease McrA
VNGYDRYPNCYGLSEILPHIGNHTNGAILLDGDRVSTSSLRLRMFKKKGIDCVGCGVKGSFFVKERNLKTAQTNDECRFHLNLYAIRKDGADILMTQDHIVPRSKGGANLMENLQLMCMKCNQKKGDKTCPQTSSP